MRGSVCQGKATIWQTHCQFSGYPVYPGRNVGYGRDRPPPVPEKQPTTRTWACLYPGSFSGKILGREAAMKVSLNAVQVHGGYGYTKEYMVEKYMRDAKIFQIFEGTAEVQRLVIAGDVLRG